MSSQKLRLETVKPVDPSPDAEPQAAIATQPTFNSRSRPARSRKSGRRRRRGRGINDEFQVLESEANNKPKSWLSRLLSGWMFSLLVHCLLLLWLGSLITNFKSAGPLTLNFSTVGDESIHEIPLDISPLELDPLFDNADGGALDSEVAEPEQTPILEDELQPIIDPNIAEPLLEIQLLEQPADASMFEPVNLGTIGLDEGNKVTKEKGDGKAARVKFFGLESAGNRFVFVIDCSGSMGDERRYQRAVYELTRSMDMLKSSHQFLVILYNSATYPMLDMTEENIRMLPATNTNKKRVRDWLKTQQPEALTLPMVAMKMSLDLKPSTIFFLSDGEFFDSTIPMLDQFNIDDRSTGAAKIPINTITLGSTGLGAPMMRYIADESRGQFRWVQ